MMTVMADVAEQKRGAEPFFGCEAGDSCGVASNKRIKIGCSGGGGGKEKKDKFGERVAALQRLVSPFGKTDTATVLQEAAAYIKFLHEQLEVLSAPYIWAPPAGTALPGSEKRCSSLRSHGLCLVPVAYSSGIVTGSSNGADIWAPVGAGRS